mmetsp:Transcript_17595/g.29705  ORF Transcript_17595/g.29705 Transcript_17595/m.29705 type:complete len:95 (+) Transcript_17595:731-1015(+)|eukprot:CAMPEP_0168618248 /NCGR_PEP_ID=MMETSP0449_2-20121227/5973_1 /TAXON_ID=1082188 /ORGANISM="Strombidium rassoulzadegani, Strain ras09" /LENGTH=94 /DNA_ID=CAMNT_0008659115 /DNA_START=601 /DNA_END=885 /DNA_ORIENTATION=+
MFCGHEYTLKNIDFCLQAIEPEGAQKLKQFRDELEEKLMFQLSTVPTSVSQEKEFNLFMRCRDESLQKAHGNLDPVHLMQFLREWKNSGKMPKM